MARLLDRIESPSDVRRLAPEQLKQLAAEIRAELLTTVPRTGGHLASTAVTDAAYVFFNAAVVSRKRLRAANWSAIWYLLSAFAVISYTENAFYVAFAALGSWLGAFASVTWLRER